MYCLTLSDQIRNGNVCEHRRVPIVRYDPFWEAGPSTPPQVGPPTYILQYDNSKEILCDDQRDDGKFVEGRSRPCSGKQFVT